MEEDNSEETDRTDETKGPGGHRIYSKSYFFSMWGLDNGNFYIESTMAGRQKVERTEGERQRKRERDVFIHGCVHSSVMLVCVNFTLTI